MSTGGQLQNKKQRIKSRAQTSEFLTEGKTLHHLRRQKGRTWQRTNFLVDDGSTILGIFLRAFLFSIKRLRKGGMKSRTMLQRIGKLCARTWS